MFYLETVFPEKKEKKQTIKTFCKMLNPAVQTDLCEEYGSKVKVLKRIERDLKR